MKWTPYLDDCLRVLADNAEKSQHESSDCLLVQIIRVQLIIEKLAQAPWHDGSAEHSVGTEMPPQFLIKALQAQLKAVKEGIPLKLAENGTLILRHTVFVHTNAQPIGILLLHLRHAELSIHEVGLSKSFIDGPDFHRLEYLWASLYAIKDWFQIFLTFTPSQCFGMSMAALTQMSHCIIALHRLSTFEHADWDQASARTSLDISCVLDDVVSKLNQMKVAMTLDPGISDDKDIYSVIARTLSSIKVWWDSKIATEETPQPNDTNDELVMEWLDDAWLQDVFATSQYAFEPFTQRQEFLSGSDKSEQLAAAGV